MLSSVVMATSRQETSGITNTSQVFFQSFGSNGQHTSPDSPTEFDMQWFQRAAGDYSHLAILVAGTNNRVNACTYKSRIDTGGSASSSSAADGNQTVSITASTSGWFEDTTHSDTVASGDKFGAEFVPGSGNGQLIKTPMSRVKFVPSSGASNYMFTIIVNGASSIFSGVGTQYFPIAGQPGSLSETTEANYKFTTRSPGSYSRLQAHVSANSVSAASTLKFRKAAADGNQVVSITASTSGIFEDTTHSDSVSNGDDVDYSFACGGSGTAITLVQVGCMFTSSAEDFEFLAATDQNFGRNAISTSTTNFYPVVGFICQPGTPDESFSKLRMPVKYTWDKLRLRLGTNFASGAVSVTLRKNGVDTSVTLSVTAGASGTFEDTTNTASIDVGDDVNYAISPPSSAFFLVGMLSSRLTPPSGGAQGVAGTYRGPGQIL